MSSTVGKPSDNSTLLKQDTPSIAHNCQRPPVKNPLSNLFAQHHERSKMLCPLILYGQFTHGRRRTIGATAFMMLGPRLSLAIGRRHRVRGSYTSTIPDFVPQARILQPRSIAKRTNQIFAQSSSSSSCADACDEGTPKSSHACDEWTPKS